MRRSETMTFALGETAQFTNLESPEQAVAPITTEPEPGSRRHAALAATMQQCWQHESRLWLARCAVGFMRGGDPGHVIEATGRDRDHQVVGVVVAES